MNATESKYSHVGNNYLCKTLLSECISMVITNLSCLHTFIVVTLTSGAVRSYLVDSVEIPEVIGLSSFVIGQWDMLLAMCVIIVVFIFIEHHHFSV